MILAIDAGNSRTKWGVFDNAGELKAHGITQNTELDMPAPIAWRACQRAVISNVAGAAIAAKLDVMLQPFGIPVRWAVSAAYACGVKNAYTDPQQLGSDRWAALVAAWQHYRAPCVVVNAGTALTIDALAIDVSAGDRQQGIFLGGLIVPGFKLMQESLIQTASGIAPSYGSVQSFPVNTGDALFTGTLSAMVGAIASMMAKLHQRTGQQARCILSGGDAALLADAMSGVGGIANNIVIADNLVLQGLLLLGTSDSVPHDRDNGFAV